MCVHCIMKFLMLHAVKLCFLHCAAHDGCGYEALNVEEIHNMVTELLLSAFDM